MNITGKNLTPFKIALRLFLLAAFLILPLSSTITVRADSLPSNSTEVSPVSGTSTTPRAETLYFNGQQWGSVNCWNPYSSGCNNAMAIAEQDNARVTMFETPYLYNMLDGKVYPLLADGSFSWNSGLTQLTFTLKSAAHWSDGTPVTAADVAYTWATHIKYNDSVGGSYSDSITGITASNANTVVVHAALGSTGKAINPLKVQAYLSTNYVIQKAWTQTLEARSGYNRDNLLNDPANDVVYSGPYHKYFADDSKVILVRDDNYWGKDASMFGKLPSPKYLAHVIYADDAAALTAFKAGNVDVSQSFIGNVQNLWLNDHLPVSTYLTDAPYDIGASLPTAFYNLNSYGLDQVAVRKAIAIAVNYDSIISNAITNQSATFTQVPRSLMNPTPGEQALYDRSDPTIKALQWAGNDIAGAEKLLDDAGIKDTDHDGWREYKGVKLSYIASAPNGWNDWTASIDLVASAARSIGIDVTANHPEWSDYSTAVTNWPLPATGYDIFMMYTDGAGPSQPWGRIDHLINSKYAKTTNNWSGNWGGYVNSAADTLINAIPTLTNAATKKADYTSLVKIYLTDIPSFTLMYRPQSFQTVNESVWTGFPHQGDGTNPPVPPLDLTDGWSIAGLYNLIGPVPGAFTKSSPTNAATGQPANATLTWTTSSNVTTYQYCYSTTNHCSNWVSNGTSTSKALSSLTANTTYYWNVRAVNANGTIYANASTTDWSFKTGMVPASFNKSSPANGATNQPGSLTLKWGSSAGATSYQYCYSKTNNCSNWTSNLTATSKTLTGLAANTTYYWNVRAISSYGTTYANASTTDWSFKTGIKPGAFNKSSPANAAANQHPNPTLTWAASSAASSYNYCIDTVNDNNCNTSWINSGTATSVALSGLSFNTTYYWQVRANNNFGVTYANNSAWWSFKVTPLITKQFTSTGAQDGWILETTESSGVGGTLNSSDTTFYLGDSAAKQQYRGVLSFSTGSVLPDTAVITAVSLKVKESAVTAGGDPVAIFQGFMADVKNGFLGTSAALQAGDFQSAASGTYGPFSPTPVSNVYTFDLSSAQAHINKLSASSGLTQVRLRFKLDDNNDAFANYIALFSGNNSADKPTLIITYYVP